MYGLTNTRSHPGFSLIEILVALAIIGGLLAAVPRMLTRPNYLQQAEGLLQTIVGRAQLESLAQGRMHRVLIEIAPSGQIALSIQQTDASDPMTSKEYQTISAPYARVVLPADVALTGCVINDVDEMAGGILTSCWIFVYGDGTTQTSQIVLTDTVSNRSARLVLNPLYATWV